MHTCVSASREGVCVSVSLCLDRDVLYSLHAWLTVRAGSEKDRLDVCFPDCVEDRSPSVVSLTVDEATFHSAFVPTYTEHTERFIRLFFRRNCTLAGVSRGKCFFMLWKTKTKETTVYPVVKCIIVDSLRTDSAISQAFPSKLFCLIHFVIQMFSSCCMWVKVKTVASFLSPLCDKHLKSHLSFTQRAAFL